MLELPCIGLRSVFPASYVTIYSLGFRYRFIAVLTFRIFHFRKKSRFVNRQRVRRVPRRGCCPNWCHHLSAVQFGRQWFALLGGICSGHGNFPKTVVQIDPKLPRWSLLMLIILGSKCILPSSFTCIYVRLIFLFCLMYFRCVFFLLWYISYVLSVC